MLNSLSLNPIHHFQERRLKIMNLKELNINYFEIQNRRFLGNKYKLLNFIKSIIFEKAPEFQSFCDIFAGTGVVGTGFNNNHIKIISNDLLLSNYICISSFLETSKINKIQIYEKLEYLNNIALQRGNYFSENYGGTFFSIQNSIKIGNIREEIDVIAESETEKKLLLTSLLYAVDKIANTVGHYDAFRSVLDKIQDLKLLFPKINYTNNLKNEVYNRDANELIKEIETDVLYIDPPYNSRQYSGAYHLLENLISWKKPKLEGKAKKMDRSHLQSKYCLKEAPEAFADLITNANCKHILVSYNNTGETLNSRSNARITDKEMIEILSSKGKLEIFEESYKTFQTGKSKKSHNKERIFYCRVR